MSIVRLNAHTMEKRVEIKEKEEIKYYKHSSHATYNLTWHCVWITKYRRGCMNKEIHTRLEKIIKWLCKENYINVISLWFESDHVHCFLSFSITSYIPDIFRILKWRTSRVIRDDFKEHLRSYYRRRWNKSLCAVWYFFFIVWSVDEETIKRYVEQQWGEDCRGEEIKLL